MLKTIAPQQVRIGMFIHGFDGAWMDHPFWRSKFMVDTPAQAQKIQQSAVAGVVIDLARGVDVADDAGVPNADFVASVLMEMPDEPPTLWSPMPAQNSALDQADALIKQSIPTITDMFADARLGKALDVARSESLVEDICASVTNNPHALINVARLKSHDEYTYMHSVAVCALMIALGRQLNLSDNLLRKVGMAGMLHDVGKAVMPQQILNHPGKLSDEEFEVMRSHPRRGHRLLEEGGRAGPVVLDVCLHHHEKVDGTGYPDRLQGDAISLVAKMGAVCDVYDAITSNRPYKAAWGPAESLRKMAQWMGHFDPKVFQAFVRTVGIYPTGSLVRMHSKLLAIVVEQNNENLLKPRVKAFYSLGSGMRIPPRDIDLNAPGCRDDILGYEPQENWDMEQLNAYWRHPGEGG